MQNFIFSFFRSIKFLLFVLFSIFFIQAIHAQNAEREKLAHYYFERNEFDKAKNYFEDLLKGDAQSPIYFSKYIACLNSLGEFKQAEKIIKKQIKNFPDFMYAYIELGNLYNKKGETEKASKAYLQGVDNIGKNPFLADLLGNEFIKIGLYDFAIQTYKTFRKNTSNKNAFSRELSLALAFKKDLQSLVDENLDQLKDNPQNIEIIESDLQNYLKDKSDFDILKKSLLNRIQKDREVNAYSEMLIWLYLEIKEYSAALNQTIAFDKRTSSGGKKVYYFALQCAREEEYETSIKALEYVIEINKNTLRVWEFREQLLKSKKNFITQKIFTENDLNSLDTEYKSFLSDYGKSDLTAAAMKEYANFKALYLHQTQEGISLLLEILNFKGLPKDFLAECKIELGDLYLLNNEIWEPTLLYGQVMTLFKDAPLGQLAKFKSCKLDYYRGDFQLAKNELNILKASTSQLIANDALELSLLIGDNTGIDSNETALKFFSKAELDIYQNKFQSAEKKFDSIQVLFPGHSLSDDILFQKAKLESKKQNWEKSLEYYKEVYTLFALDILADNSLFSSAEIYQFKLKNMEKANELYQKILTDFPGSVYVIEARKRFRSIRGD